MNPSHATADGPRSGFDDRVARVHAHARVTLAMAAGFVVAASVAVVVPHDTGPWLPLHLFLVGGLLGAISGATQLLGVTWSASPAPPAALVITQRTALGIGALGIALGRELGSTLLVGIGGTFVVTALALLAAALVGIRRRAKVTRFRPALDAYVVAVALGVLGSTAGALMAVGRAGDHPDRVLAAHATTNLLGLVGIVIAATIPWFVPTQARTKMAPRATAAAVRCLVGVLALATVSAVTGSLLGEPTVAGIGLATYGLGVVATFAFVPRLGRRQLDWAGPRLVQLFAGLAWWALCVGLLADAAFRSQPLPTDVVEALVVGAYAQILAGSLAYLAPVLRGGGHIRLGAGFGATRSWVGLVVGNVAAVAALSGRTDLLAAAILVWVLDLAARATRLRFGPPSSTRVEP